MSTLSSLAPLSRGSLSVSVPSPFSFSPPSSPRLTLYRPPPLAAAIVVGLLVMMWPILTKVQYETLPRIFRTSRMWYQIGISLVLNWIVGPFVMLAVAWATLPDLPTYRTGVIMVGLARCIAMVMVSR